MERAERVKLENAVKSGSLPDDAKVGLSSSLAAAVAAKQFSATPTPPPPPGFGGMYANMYYTYSKKQLYSVRL